jgi:hypothetical protein
VYSLKQCFHEAGRTFHRDKSLEGIYLPIGMTVVCRPPPRSNQMHCPTARPANVSAESRAFCQVLRQCCTRRVDPHFSFEAWVPCCQLLSYVVSVLMLLLQLQGFCQKVCNGRPNAAFATIPLKIKMPICKHIDSYVAIISRRSKMSSCRRITPYVAILAPQDGKVQNADVYPNGMYVLLPKGFRELPQKTMPNKRRVRLGSMHVCTQMPTWPHLISTSHDTQ